MLRKTLLALAAVATVGLLAPNIALARGGGGHGGGAVSTAAAASTVVAFVAAASAAGASALGSGWAQLG